MRLGALWGTLVLRILAAAIPCLFLSSENSQLPPHHISVGLILGLSVQSRLSRALLRPLKSPSPPTNPCAPVAWHSACGWAVLISKATGRIPPPDVEAPSKAAAAFKGEKPFTNSQAGRRPAPPPRLATHLDDGEGGAIEHRILRGYDASKRPRKTHEIVSVYADGACPHNGRPGALAGIGISFGDDFKRSLALPLIHGPQTNQRAELASLLTALLAFQYYDDLQAREHTGACNALEQKLVVYSDSSYAVKCVGPWGDRWQHNNWKCASGADVKNADLVQAVRLLIGKREEHFPRGACWRGAVHFVPVRAHAGVIGNELADRLAVQGSQTVYPRRFGTPSEETLGVEDAPFVLQEYEKLVCTALRHAAQTNVDLPRGAEAE
ncbi:putative ribonuclease H [Cyclospora cayetanensis]|uniref:ribonuclease H n=1 Tax=Cyclospora cayetanensis TaxID=88456 RepID=A0A1D3D1P6_9EIME|nr:putative ribonuclease H [Cyclospora cayetanensis]